MTDQIVKPTTPTIAVPAGSSAVAKTDTKVAPKKKKAVKIVPRGNAYIQATYNNTIITITDPNGAVLGWSSSGTNGFKGPKKATPYAASVVVKDLMTKLADYAVKEVNVFIKGIGGGRESAIRALHGNGLNVLNITDLTPIPHNGCRPPKRRRV
ncbi:MAG: 30S ribosomal protein S11 [Candidatus Magasanikbacteria bacterium]|nr:30S ribosomal protein S11 [Candidatus Magasanikbacteria bacterium]